MIVMIKYKIGHTIEFQIPETDLPINDTYENDVFSRAAKYVMKKIQHSDDRFFYPQEIEQIIIKNE